MESMTFQYVNLKNSPCHIAFIVNILLGTLQAPKTDWGILKSVISEVSAVSVISDESVTVSFQTIPVFAHCLHFSYETVMTKTDILKFLEKVFPYQNLISYPSQNSLLQ
jgi:hypothetical protein